MSGVTEHTVRRLGIVGLIVVLMLGTLVTRLWYLQVLEGDALAHESTVNHVRIVTKQAPRGRLLDRNGAVIAGNEPSLVVGIRREEFRRLPQRQQRVVEAKLGELLGMTVAEIEDRLKDPRPSPYSPIPIAHGVPREIVEIISERQADLPDVEWSAEPVRRYPLGSLAAQTIGFVNEVSAKELKQHPDRYRLGDSIGRTGLERRYDGYLRGTNGYTKKEVDASGAVRSVLSEREYTPGNDLVLTIDAKIQRIAEQSLAQAAVAARGRYHKETKTRFPAPAGAAVVLDATTGAVVALANFPTFDITKFVADYPKKEFNAYYASILEKAAHQPLLNRAIGEGGTSYPPGSTFKPVTAIAALSTGLASVHGGYPCTSDFKLGNPPTIFRNWRPESATISLGQALVESCDTVFYRFGAEWFSRELAKGDDVVPYEALPDYSRKFGLGKATGIDIDGETSGRVPDRVFKRDLWKASRKSYCQTAERTHEKLWEDLCLNGFRWEGGDTVNMSTGQGYTLVTPLQMAVVYAALANGGSIVQPHLVSLVSRDGKVVRTFKPVVRSKLNAAPATLSYVAHALAGVTTKGTAEAVFAGWPLDRIPVAAKTGTAENSGGQQPTSWFASFAPANGHPRYVVVAVVEKAGFGAQVAGPVVRRIMDALFDRPLTPIVYGTRTD